MSFQWSWKDKAFYEGGGHSRGWEPGFLRLLETTCVYPAESGAAAVFLAWGGRRVSRYGEERSHSVGLASFSLLRVHGQQAANATSRPHSRASSGKGRAGAPRAEPGKGCPWTHVWVLSLLPPVPGERGQWKRPGLAVWSARHLWGF